jgi:hypothetical protein
MGEGYQAKDTKFGRVPYLLHMEKSPYHINRQSGNRRTRRQKTRKEVKKQLLIPSTGAPMRRL